MNRKVDDSSKNAYNAYNSKYLTPKDLNEFYDIKQVNEEGKRGAVLLITEKQLVIVLNGKDDDCNCRDNLVNTYLRIYKKKKIIDPIEYIEIEKEIQKHFITCQLINDLDEGKVYAAFPISLITPHSITSNQLSVFELFYEKYNNVFKEASEKHKTPIVCFSYINDKNETSEIWCKDLTLLLEYLRKIVDYDKTPYKRGEIIVGNAFSKKLSKR